MKCKHCGHPLTAAAEAKKVCPLCGKAVGASVQSTAKSSDIEAFFEKKLQEIKGTPLKKNSQGNATGKTERSNAAASKQINVETENAEQREVHILAEQLYRDWLVEYEKPIEIILYSNAVEAVWRNGYRASVEYRKYNIEGFPVYCSWYAGDMTESAPQPNYLWMLAELLNGYLGGVYNQNEDLNEKASICGGEMLRTYTQNAVRMRKR